MSIEFIDDASNYLEDSKQTSISLANLCFCIVILPSCVPYAASFSGLSIFDYLFGIFYRLLKKNRLKQYGTVCKLNAWIARLTKIKIIYLHACLLNPQLIYIKGTELETLNHRSLRKSINEIFNIQYCNIHVPNFWCPHDKNEII